MTLLLCGAEMLWHRTTLAVAVHANTNFEPVNMASPVQFGSERYASMKTTCEQKLTCLGHSSRSLSRHRGIPLTVRGDGRYRPRLHGQPRIPPNPTAQVTDAELSKSKQQKLRQVDTTKL